MDKPIAPDAIKNTSVLQELKAANLFASQREVYKPQFKALDPGKAAELPEIVTKTIRFRFKPNQSGLDEQYDPNIPNVLKDAAVLAGMFPDKYILVEGHSDTSFKGQDTGAKAQVREKVVKDLSQDRAKAVAKALVDRFKFDANKVMAVGLGWDKPVTTDPTKQADNRRVEVKVLEAEQAE